MPWDLGNQFGGGVQEALTAQEIANRMAGEEKSRGIQHQQLDESRDVANATLTHEGAPNLDTLAAGNAYRDAISAGAPADTLSPTGAAADQAMTGYAGRMAGMQDAQLEGIKTKNAYEKAAADWMSRRVPAGQYNDKKAISERMKSLDTLRSYGKMTPEDQAEYRDLSDRFNSLSGIEPRPPAPPPAPGLLAGLASRMSQALFPSGSAPASAALPPGVGAAKVLGKFGIH